MVGGPPSGRHSSHSKVLVVSVLEVEVAVELEVVMDVAVEEVVVG